MAMQEDLATLFSRNLSLHNPPPQPAEPIYTYSITQHYHHSSHVVAQRQQHHHEQAPIPRSASSPPHTDQLTTEIILSRHGVDANTLFPTQIDLFRRADSSQQMRLIELWRISPPNNGGHALSADLWHGPTTTLADEEAMARIRYEKRMIEERLSRAGGDELGPDAGDDTMSDSTNNQPLTPIQSDNRRWMAGAAPQMLPEPYMASGYEELAQREYEHTAAAAHPKEVYSHFGTAVGGPNYHQATDPVYNNPNVGGNWEQLIQQRQQAMENQYGAFQQHEYGMDDEEML